MKKLLLFFVCLVFLFSCQEKKNGADITKYVCSELLYTFELKTAEFRRTVEFLGNTVPLRYSLQELDRMEAWRTKYLKNKNKANLLAYSDSIFTRYLPFNSDSEVAWQLSNVRNVVSQSNDTLDHLNLFFWTLKAEEGLRDVYISKTGAYERSFKVPLYINSVKNRLGDTIYAAFMFSESDKYSWKIGFDSLYVINKNTKETHPRAIIKAGPYFLIQIVPKERGEFLIKGEVEVLKFKGYTWHFPFEKYFKVI